MIRPDTFAFDNTYAAELEGFYARWNGERVPEPRIVHLNAKLAVELSLDSDALASESGRVRSRG